MNGNALIMIIFVIFIGCIIGFRLSREGFTTNDFDGKTILIAGASGNIGTQLALYFSDFSCQLILTAKNEAKMTKLKSLLQKKNCNPEVHILNIDNKKSIDSFTHHLRYNRKIDYFINCINKPSKQKHIMSENYDDMVDQINVNINGTFYLTKKIIKKMRGNRTGKVILLSSHSHKNPNTDYNHAGEIISKSTIEMMGKMFSEENYRYNIAVATIRIDSGYYKRTKYDTENIKNPVKKSMYKKINKFNRLISDDPKYIVKKIVEICKKKNNQINGKVFSTTYSSQKNHGMISNSPLNMHEKFYKKYELNKYPENGEIYVNKQSPLPMCPRLKNFLKNYDYSKNQKNFKSKYPKRLGDILSKQLRVDASQIVFFKDEYSALKKIISLFVPKHNNILACHPIDEKLLFVTTEGKIDMKYTVYKASGNIIQPRYHHLINQITPKTKMIYLSNPDNITGQCLLKKDFEDFLKKLPDDIVVLLDETYIDLTTTTAFDSLKYLNENVIVMRSFANSYSYESLDITYAIGSEKFIEILEDSNVRYNQIDNFHQDIAIEALKDTKYIRDQKTKIVKLREETHKLLRDKDVEHYPSDSNFFLVKGNRKRKEILEACEKENIIIDTEKGFYNSYWTLPLADSETNKKIVEIISSDF